MILDNFELSTIHYTLFYYLDNANLDEDDDDLNDFNALKEKTEK